MIFYIFILNKMIPSKPIGIQAPVCHALLSVQTCHSLYCFNIVTQYWWTLCKWDASVYMADSSII